MSFKDLMHFFFSRMGKPVIKAQVNKTIKDGDRSLCSCGITYHFVNDYLHLNANISDLWFVQITMVRVQQQNHFVLILVLMFIK